MKQEIEPRNSKGQLHGYQEWYWNDGRLMFREIAKKGKSIGYYENHLFKTTTFYII